MTLFDLAGASDSAVLKDIIAERIGREGPISFRDYMDLALYHPVHGYYVACDPARDYQTSPRVHPVFGAAIGRLLSEMWDLLDRPSRFQVFEAGAGDGRLAADVLRWLSTSRPDAFEALSYSLQDPSYAHGDAFSRVERVGLPLDLVRVAETLPAPGSITGVIFSNELLDAFPVHRVRVEGGRLEEMLVGLEDGGLVETWSEPPAEVRCYFERLGLLPGEGCQAEVNLDALEWTRAAAAALAHGYLLTLDYGYPAVELYASWRRQGTFLTFHRQTRGEGAFVRVGRQDMTASIDLTSVAAAGEEAGLRTLGVTTQARLLSTLGVSGALSRPPAAGDIEAFYQLRRAVQELLDPAGLGRVQALLQGRGVPVALPTGFGGAHA